MSAFSASPVTGQDPAGTPAVAITEGGATTARDWRMVRQFLFTFFTNWVLFGIFFVQGVIVARCLGPEGRGEFGTILFFPRDLLLYVGMMGGADLITSLATRYPGSARDLRWAAVRLGTATGLLTALAAFVLAAFCLFPAGKGGLLGLVFATSLFLPFEHIQMMVSGVDRGQGAFGRYNLNRLVFAAVFPLLVLGWWGSGRAELYPSAGLEVICLLFVLSRIFGLLPTLFWGSDSRGTSGLPEHSITLAKQDLGARRLLQDGRGFGLSMLATECFERLDILLIVLLASYADSGNYFVAIPAATLVTLLPNAAGLFAFNAGANPKFVPTRWTLGSAILAALAAQVAVAFGLWLILPWLISTVFGAGFETAVTFALWLLPACALKGYLQFADGFLKGRGQALVGVRARCGAIGLLLAATWLLYPRWQLLAIPASAALGQLFAAIVITWACWRYGTQPPKLIGSMREEQHAQ